MSGCDLQLPPGFRFHPTDEELVLHYLCRKCGELPISVPIIAEIDLYKYDPWQLPGLALYGEKEWYFFSPRDRKYPNGSRPNRAAGSGYWKATGADKAVGRPKTIGIKKALVFYIGKAPKGEKTNWIMHEYRLANVDRSAARNKNSLRLDDWVLCRVYNKKGEPGSDNKPKILNKKPGSLRTIRSGLELTEDQKPCVLPPHLLAPVHSNRVANEMACFGSPDSMPRLHADSSCSEHVPSPAITCESEAHSGTTWQPEWDRPIEIPPVQDEFGPGSIFPNFEMDPVVTQTGFKDSLHDIFMFLGKPF